MAIGALKNHFSPSPELRAMFRGRSSFLVRIAAASFVGAALEALFLVLVSRSALVIANRGDSVGIVGDVHVSVVQACVIAFVLVVIRCFLSVLAGRWSASLNASTVADVRNRAASAYLSAPWSVKQLHPGGRLQELLTTYTDRLLDLLGAVTSLISSGLSLVALLIIAVAIDPLASLLVAAAAFALGLLLRPLRTRIKREAAAAALAGSRYAESLNEISSLDQEVETFNTQVEVGKVLRSLVDNHSRSAWRYWYLRHLVTPLYATLAYSGLLAALVVASQSQSADLKAVGVILLLMLRSLTYGQAIQVSSSTVAGSSPFLNLLEAQISAYERAGRHERRRQIQSVGEIRLERVSFRYSKSNNALIDISCHIEAGEMIGIVGPSGSGKSTLVQLLLGLRSPDTGRIAANGASIDDIDPTVWARLVGFVPQTPRLFDGTIEENLRFFRESVSREDIEQACRTVNLHEEIIAKPDGYDENVGPRGAKLSGGQQQRLCIARALVQRPDVLILDEPTSALDVPSEVRIRDALTALRSTTTILIIAHRISTLSSCDRIMVIRDGRLEAFGAADELRSGSSFFSEALLLSEMLGEDLIVASPEQD